MIDEVFHAARLGDADRLKELLAAVPEFANTENKEGMTPLGFAAHFGHVEAVIALLDGGAEVNARSHSTVSYIPSNTALHAAIAGERNLSVLKALLERGADPNVIDSNGQSSLHTAVFHSDNVELVQLLMAYGADAKLVCMDGSGKDAAAIALENHRMNVYDWLQQRENKLA